MQSLHFTQTLRSRLLEVFVLALGATVGAGSSSAQVGLTRTDGVFECDPHINCQEKWSTEFSRLHPDLTQRDKQGVLIIKLQDGRSIAPPQDDCPQCFEAIDLLVGGRFLALHTLMNEDSQWYVVDRKTGKTTLIEGYPLFSPNKELFVAAEADAMNSHFLDIYSVNADGIKRVHRAINAGDAWFPSHVRWLDNRSIAFTRSTGDSVTPEAPQVLRLSKGTWKLEPH